jgi:hypothetical protein
MILGYFFSVNKARKIITSPKQQESLLIEGNNQLRNNAGIPLYSRTLKLALVDILDEESGIVTKASAMKRSSIRISNIIFLNHCRFPHVRL